jgi:hypothetical protein
MGLSHALTEVILALFVKVGRIFSVRGIVTLTVIGGLIWFTYEGIVGPEAFIAVVVSTVAFYFKEREKQESNGD